MTDGLGGKERRRGKSSLFQTETPRDPPFGEICLVGRCLLARGPAEQECKGKACLSAGSGTEPSYRRGDGSPASHSLPSDI